MKKKVLEKLRSRRGDSIAEVLIALLISVVALVMLAGMITSSTRLIQRSKDAMEQYDAANNALSAMTANAPTANDTFTVSSKTLSVADAVTNDSVKLTEAGVISVKVYENTAYGGDKVIAYKKS